MREFSTEFLMKPLSWIETASCEDLHTESDRVHRDRNWKHLRLYDKEAYHALAASGRRLQEEIQTRC